MESGSGPQSPAPGGGSDPPPRAPQSPMPPTPSPEAPQSPGGPQSPSPEAPQSPGGFQSRSPEAPQSPGGFQSPGGLQSPGYSGPVPPGGWRQPPPAAAPAAYGGQFAGWGRRLGATILDGLIVGIPALVIMGILGVGVLGASSTDSGFALILSGIAAGLVSLLVFAFVTFIYAPLTMMRGGERNGQTFGKQIVGIRVVRTSGDRIDFLWAALREVAVKSFAVGVASSFTFGLAWLANYLWPLWDDENRALHDMVAQTRVVAA